MSVPASSVVPASGNPLDWRSLVAAPSASAPLNINQALQQHALLQELHALTLDRTAAQQAHANSAAQIAALTQNLQDALLIHSQLQAKIQVLEYGLKVERNRNAELMSRLKEKQPDSVESPPSGEKSSNPNPTTSSSESGAVLSPRSRRRRTLSYHHSLPSYVPPPDPSSHVDPAVFAAYMAATNSGTPLSPHDEGKSMPTPPAMLNYKPHVVHSNPANSNPGVHTPPSHGSTANFSTPPSSNYLSTTPATAIKTRSFNAPSPSSSQNKSDGSNTFLEVKKSPNRASAPSPLTTISKPPVLTANTFMPPTEDELAAEIASAKSPPASHPVFLNQQSYDPDALFAINHQTNPNVAKPTATSAPSSSATVYTYNNDDGSTTTKDGESTSRSYTYSTADEDDSALSKTTLDLSSVTIESVSDVSVNGTNNTSAPAQQQPTRGHVRFASSTNSAFEPLSPATAGTAPSPATSPLATTTTARKEWKPKVALRSHLDSVRSIAFDRSASASASDATWLLSGSEDGTANLWSLNTALASASRKGAAQAQPCHIYRGHSGMLTAVTLNSAYGAFTAGVDGKVVQWSLPGADADLYGSYGDIRAFEQQVFDHSDAVWSIDVHDSGAMLTASADGVVAIWSVKTSQLKSVKSSLSGVGEKLHSVINSQLVPASVQFIPSSNGSLAVVAYTNGSVAVIDVSTGKLVNTFSEDGSPSRATQVCAHPTEQTLVSSHVDASLRFWDVRSNARVATIAAHRGIVSCLSMDGTGENLASGSHDESIRVWGVQDRKIRQVFDTHQTHRLKNQEAIHAVTYHPTMPYLASCGADGVIKIYQ